ncbi:MAG: hypothetical protein J3Q66DRAFT_375028 [Benniella sp.]|nr:MAG: hypothetical protein J3Q66DRAFT_375028 [Benniella sp.]
MHRRHPLLQRVNHLAYIISVFSLLLHPPVQAQSYRPYLTYYPGSTYVDGKALYVTGGQNVSRQTVNQTFMIDLSVSWKTTSPVYKELPISRTGYAFDIQANMWTPSLKYSGELGYAERSLSYVRYIGRSDKCYDEYVHRGFERLHFQDGQCYLHDDA